MNRYVDFIQNNYNQLQLATSRQKLQDAAVTLLKAFRTRVNLYVHYKREMTKDKLHGFSLKYEWRTYFEDVNTDVKSDIK